MKKKKSEGKENRQPQRQEKPAILAVTPNLVGVSLKLACRKCGICFENLLPTVAGLGAGELTCPDCQTAQMIFPEDFLAALNKTVPTVDFPKSTQINEEATQVVESWYRHQSFVACLTYKGINLGEPAEKALFASVTAGLALLHKEESSAND